MGDMVAGRTGGYPNYQANYPWDQWLVFFDFQQEREFWEAHMRNILLGLDRIAYVDAILHLLAIGVNLLLEGKAAGVVVHLDLVVGVLLATYLLSLRSLNCQCYQDYRTWLAGAFRVYFLMISTKWTVVVQPTDESVPYHINGKLIAQSGLPILVFTPLVLQLPFKAHLIVHGLSLAAVVWNTTSQFCGSQSGRDSMHLVISSIDEWLNTNIFSSFNPRAHMNKEAHGDLMSHLCMDDILLPGQLCWMVIIFAYAVLGFVMPSAVMYCMESRARAKFLTAQQPRQSQVYSRMFWEVVGVACWFSLVTSILLWIVLHCGSELRNVLLEHVRHMQGECLAR